MMPLAGTEEDAPVAAFIYTAADVAGITFDSPGSTRNTRIDPHASHRLLFEDQILEALEEIVQEKLSDAD